MKILIIAATHGNELLGIQLYQHLLSTRSALLEHVDFIIGNPRAYAASVRYIDCDLNRSYQSLDGDKHEEERAAEITRYVANTQPDLILDMHTTTTVQPNCLIVSDTTDETRKRFMRACHLENVLQIQPMGDASTLGRSVVSYEIPNTDIDDELLVNMTNDLQRFIDGSAEFANKRVFTMIDKIYQKDVSDAEAASFVNFQMHPLGFVPIMTGNNSYRTQTDYYGFKTSAHVESTL